MSVRSVVVASAVALSLVGCGGGVEQEEELGTVESELHRNPLARARIATAKYHDVRRAERDGFVPVSPCVESPEGAMGIHYLKPDRLDLVLNETEPELLLYLPTDEGLRLVAVEYMVPIFQDGVPYTGEAPPANPGTAPVLFGQTFQGPMPGHGPGEPWHYDLHVWIWSRNPAGTFAVWNPALSCGG